MAAPLASHVADLLSFMLVLEENRRGEQKCAQPQGCRAFALLFLSFALFLNGLGAPKLASADAKISEPLDTQVARTKPARIVTAPELAEANTFRRIQLVRLINVLDPNDCAPTLALSDTGLALDRPVSGTLTQPFDWRHAGVDFVADPDAQVVAAHGGEVIFAGWNNEGYGYLVTVLHTPIVITTPVTTEVHLKTHYAHLKQIVVSEGAQVKAGQPIGQIGSTGYSSGPHLHFEVRLDSVAVNPQCFWSPAD